MQTAEKPKSTAATKYAIGILSKGPMIGRQSVTITADMARGSLVLELIGTGITLKLAAGDVAAVLNEAVRKSIESGVKYDE